MTRPVALPRTFSPARVTCAAVLFGLLFFRPGQAAAQSPVVPYPEWISLGFGTWSPHAGSGGSVNRNLSANLSYNFQPRRTAYHIAAEYDGDAAILFGGPQFYLAALNVGVGRRQVLPFFVAAQFIGPSLRLQKRSNIDGSTHRSISPGIMADFQLYLKPFGPLLPELGLGVELFGNAGVSGVYRGLRFAILFNNAL